MSPIQAYHTYGHLKQTLWRRHIFKETLQYNLKNVHVNEQTSNPCQNPEKYIWCTRQPTDEVHNKNEEDEVKSGSCGESWYIEDYRPAIKDTEDDRKRSAIKKIFMAKVKRGSSKTVFSQNNNNESDMGTNTSLDSKINQPCKKLKSDDNQVKQSSITSKTNLQKSKISPLKNLKSLKNIEVHTKDGKNKVLNDFQKTVLAVPEKENPNLSIHDANKQHDKKYGTSETSKLEKIPSNKSQKAPKIKRTSEETQNTSKKHKHVKAADRHSAEENPLLSKKIIKKSWKPVYLNMKAINIFEKVSEQIQNNESNDLRKSNPLLTSTQKLGKTEETSQFPCADWKLERLCDWIIDVEKYLPTYKIAKLLERNERGSVKNKTSKVAINSKYVKTKKTVQSGPKDCKNIKRSSPEAKPCSISNTKSKTKVNNNSNSSMQLCLQKKRERRKRTVADPDPEENTSTGRSSSVGNHRSLKRSFVMLTDVMSSGKGNKKERIDGTIVGDTNLSSKPMVTTNNWDKIRTFKIPKMKAGSGRSFKDSMTRHDKDPRFEVKDQCSKTKKGKNELLAKGVHQYEPQTLNSKRELKTKLHKSKKIKDKETKKLNKDTKIKSKTGYRNNSYYNLRPHKKLIEPVKECREVVPIMSKSFKHNRTSKSNTAHEKGLLMTKLSKESTAKKDTKSSKNLTKPLYERPTLKVSINLSALDPNWLKCNFAHLNESAKEKEQKKPLDYNNDTYKGLVDNSKIKNLTNTECQTDQDKNTPLKEDNVVALVSTSTNVNVSVSVTENIHVAQNLTLLPIILHPPCTNNDPTLTPHPPSDTPNLQNPSSTGQTLPNALCPPSPLPDLVDPVSHLPSISLAPLGPSDTDQLPSPASHPPFYSHEPQEPPRTIAPSLAPQPPSHSPTVLNPLYTGYSSPSESHPPSNTSTLHNPPYNDHALLNELFPSSSLSALLDPPNTDDLFSPARPLSSYSPVSMYPSDTYQLPSPRCHPPSHSPEPLEPPKTDESSVSSQPLSHTPSLPKPCFTENAPDSASNPSSPIPITLDHPYMSLALSPASCSPSHLLSSVNRLENEVELSPTFIDKSKCDDTMIETNTANETFIDELLTEEENSRDLHYNYKPSASEKNLTKKRNDVGDILSHAHSSFENQQVFCGEVMSNSCKDFHLESVQCDNQAMESNASALSCSLSASRLSKVDSLKSTFVPSHSNKSTENKTDLSTAHNKMCYSKYSKVQTTLFSELSDTNHVMGPFCKVTKNNFCDFRSSCGNILGSQMGSKSPPNNQRGNIPEYKTEQNSNCVSVIKATKDASISDLSIIESVGVTQTNQSALRSKDSDGNLQPPLFQLTHQNSLDRQDIGSNHRVKSLSETHKDNSALGNMRNEYFSRTHSNLQDVTELSDDYTESASETDDDIQVVFCKIVKPNDNENQPMTEPIISSNSNNLSLDSKYQECVDGQISKVIVKTTPLLIDLTEDSDKTDPISIPCPVKDSTEILLQLIEHQECLSQPSTSRMGLQTHSFLDLESYSNFCQVTKKSSKQESIEGTDVNIESSKQNANQGTFDQSLVGRKMNCNIVLSCNIKDGYVNKGVSTEVKTDNLSTGSETQETNSTEVMRKSSTLRQFNLTRPTENKYFSGDKNGFEIVAKTLCNLHLYDKSKDTELVTNERSLALRLEGNSKTGISCNISFFDEDTAYYEPNSCDDNGIQEEFDGE